MSDYGTCPICGGGLYPPAFSNIELQCDTCSYHIKDGVELTDED